MKMHSEVCFAGLFSAICSIVGAFCARTFIAIFPYFALFCDFVYALFQSLLFAMSYVLIIKYSFVKVFLLSYSYFLISICICFGIYIHLTTLSIFIRIILGFANMIVILMGASYLIKTIFLMKKQL